MNRVVSGSGVQSWTNDARNFCLRPGQGCLKVLQTALDAGIIRRFHELNPLAPIIYRLVDGDDLAGLPSRTERSLRDTDQLAAFCADQLYVEIPVNEAYQSGDDLSRFSDATIAAVAQCIANGRRPVVGNFSVGNPQLAIAMPMHAARLAASPNHAPADLAMPAVARALPGPIHALALEAARAVPPLQGEWSRFVPALLAAIEAGGILGLHEYSVPGPLWVDGWLNLRYIKALEELAQLGVVIDVGIGEHFVDGGVLDGNLRGWRAQDFHLSDAQGAGLLDQTFPVYAGDTRVRYVALFEGGPYDDWRRRGFEYDVSGEIQGAVVKQYPVAGSPVVPAPIVVVPPEEPYVQEVPAMRKRLYLHQFNQLGETSYAQVAATCRLAGKTEIAIKTHQELTFIGNATNGDKSPLAIRSLMDVKKVYDAFRAEGIVMVPWCVPMGTLINAEINMAIAVANICGGIIELDTEPYTDFWEGPYNLLEPYSDGLQNAGVRYDINFDARPSGWHPFTAAQFTRVCRDADRVWTQSYWDTSGFGSAGIVVPAALEVLDLLEIPVEKRGVIFPSFGAAQYVDASKLMTGKAQSIGMWRMGDAGPPVFSALASIPDSDGPTPVAPGIDRDKLWQNIYSISLQFASTGRHADMITAHALDAAYQASKVMWGADPAV